MWSSICEYLAFYLKNNLSIYIVSYKNVPVSYRDYKVNLLSYFMSTIWNIFANCSDQQSREFKVGVNPEILKIEIVPLPLNFNCNACKSKHFYNKDKSENPYLASNFN